MEAQERELLALRRENDELKRQLRLAEDRKLLAAMCSDTSLGAAQAPRETVVLRPESPKSGGWGSKSTSRSVGLDPLPNSAPDPDILAQYEGATADEPAAGDAFTSEGPTRQYRLVGAHSSQSIAVPDSGDKVAVDRNPPTPNVSSRSSAATSDTEAATPRAKSSSTNGRHQRTAAVVTANVEPQAVEATRKPEAPPKKRNEKELYAEARKLYTSDRRDEALVLMAQIEAQFPNGDLADNAAYWRAEADYDAGRTQQALDGFLRVLRVYATGNKVEDSMLKIAYCYERFHEIDAAVDMLAALVPRARGETRQLAAQKLKELRSQQSGEHAP